MNLPEAHTGTRIGGPTWNGGWLRLEHCNEHKLGGAFVRHDKICSIYGKFLSNYQLIYRCGLPLTKI